MKKLLLVGTAMLLMATSASAQSTSYAGTFFGGGGMSPAAFQYWYGKSPAQVMRDEHVRICATNPRAPCHQRHVRVQRSTRPKY